MAKQQPTTASRLDGRHAILVGDAEASLADATLAALRAAGAAADVVDPSGIGGRSDLDAAVIFARRASGPALGSLDAAALGSSVDTALAGPLRAVHMCARTMAGSGGGSIVVVGSVDATHAYPGRAIPSIAMGALLGLVRSVAVEMSGVGVRANLVLAGPLSQTEGVEPIADEVLMERTLQRSPSGRLGDPAEVAAAIRFLASPVSDFTTGQTLRVDGGWAALNQAPDGMRFR